MDPRDKSKSPKLNGHKEKAVNGVICFWCNQFTEVEHHSDEDCLQEFKLSIANLFKWVDRKRG